MIFHNQFSRINALKQGERKLSLYWLTQNKMRNWVNSKCLFSKTTQILITKHLKMEKYIYTLYEILHMKH